MSPIEKIEPNSEPIRSGGPKVVQVDCPPTAPAMDSRLLAAADEVLIKTNVVARLQAQIEVFIIYPPRSINFQQ
jgi:hypothetical protein